MVFDIKPDDVYWCAADIGWVTGHSYIVYGPLANATTSVLYEGAPDTPAWDRWWQIIEDYKVTILYCAPTAIRAFMKQGPAVRRRSTTCRRCACSARSASRSTPRRGSGTTSTSGRARRRSSTRGGRPRPGMIMITPLPGVTTTKPGSATFPFPGIGADVVDGDGNSVPLGGGGYLVLKRPWPAMLRGIYGDPERYKETYWSRFPGMYFAGDGAKRDDEGYFWLLGRVDDVMNVSGHRISTIEVESALVDHQSGRRGGGRRQERPDHRPGDLRVRHPARPASSRPTRWPPSCASTSPRSSGRSPSPSTCCSRRTCPRPGRARSCAACCATSPRAARSATRRRSPTRAWSRPSATNTGSAEE